MTEYYARTKIKPDGDLAPKCDWQPLKDHLQNVAALARRFAEEARPRDKAFAAAAYSAGLLHDLGKYRDEFQEFLRQERKASAATQHAIYGAAWAIGVNNNFLPIAFGVAGHHAGLHNIGDLQQMVADPNRQFSQVLSKITERFKSEIGQLPECPNSPAHIRDKLSGEFYTRLLASCVVDADRLDAAFWPLQPPRDRKLEAENMLSLIKEERLRKSSSNSNTTLNRLRNNIFDECIAKGTLPQGFFSLTVPTGGGKTLSSMAFALSHARHHDLRRVIVVIPYLSIIEQNATEYSRIFGDNIVLENHSAVKPSTDLSEEEKFHLDLVAENWDSPIIVTTSVQFLESLFAAYPARYRKLHRIPRSVVIFDEVQTLPAHMLQPVFSVFRELARITESVFYSVQLHSQLFVIRLLCRTALSPKNYAK